MRIKNTAFAYNVTVNGSSNCDWGTDIGQSTKHTFTLEGFPEIVNAMVYYKIEDIENLKVILGKGNRTLKPFSEYSDTLVLASCFKKVYLNDVILEDQNFIMYILKDASEKNSKGAKNVHYGRCTLKFSNSIQYNGVSVNQKCIDAICGAFGQTKDGSWAILEMRIVNEDELHFYGFALGDKAKDYKTTEERNKDFERCFSIDDIELRRAAFKAYLFAPGTFKLVSTAKQYWNHVSVDKYKSRINFVWEALSTILGQTSEDLIIIDNVEDAERLRSMVLADERNVAYNNMLASAIVTKYVDFLSGYRTKIAANNSGLSSSSSILPTAELTNVSTQNIKYMAAIKTKPFMILGGFSGTGKSLLVKKLAFATCPCDGVLNTSETTPGNYLLVSVKPNWHDATDITGFRSSVNKNYYVTDFMRFLVKAKLYEDKNVPFFVCLDEMNLAPVEEYFADFLSVIESRKKRTDGKIVTDPIVPASVFNDSDYADDFNIFLKLGMATINPVSNVTAFSAEVREHDSESDLFVDGWLVEELKRYGLTIPSNVIIIGTVNMDDTTNSFSRKVIDRAMTFETIVEKFETSYFDCDVALNYFKKPYDGELFISDEVRATQVLDEGTFELTDIEKNSILSFINGINDDLDGSPFKISYRILNETILLFRAMKEIEKMLGEDDSLAYDSIDTSLNAIFDDIVMQKILPRIEGDFEKCNKCLVALSQRAEKYDWPNSANKIKFMIERFGSDKSGFTSFWN